MRDLIIIIADMERKHDDDDVTLYYLQHLKLPFKATPKVSQLVPLQQRMRRREGDRMGFVQRDSGREINTQREREFYRENEREINRWLHARTRIGYDSQRRDRGDTNGMRRRGSLSVTVITRYPIMYRDTAI